MPRRTASASRMRQRKARRGNKTTRGLMTNAREAKINYYIPNIDEMFQIWNISRGALTKLDKSKCSRSNPDFANIVRVRHSEMFQFSVMRADATCMSHRKSSLERQPARLAKKSRGGANKTKCSRSGTFVFLRHTCKSQMFQIWNISNPRDIIS